MTARLSNLEKKVAWSLASVFGLRMMGLFMIMPVFALYSEHLEGVSPMWIGIAIGVYGLTQAVMQIPMGMLSDRFGRKPVIISGLLIFALGSVVAAYAETIYGVVFGRALQGMGAIASAVLAMAADLSRDEQRVKVIAIIGVCIGLSFALSLLVGPLFVGSIGLSGLFLATAICALLSILVVQYVVPSPVIKAPQGDTVTIPSKLKQLIKDPQLLRLDMGIFILHLSLTATFIVLPFAFVDAGLVKSEHWKLYFPTFLLSFILMIPLIVFASKHHKIKATFRFAIALLLCSMVMMNVFLGDAIGLIVATLLFFIGFNYLEASLPSLIAKFCPIGIKGSAMGIYSSSQFFGAFLGGLLGGALYEYFGAQRVLEVVAGLMLFWFVLSQGMSEPKLLKSHTLTLKSLTSLEARQMLEKLEKIIGVVEVVVVPKEKAAYLKVDERFDLSQARAVVGFVGS